MCPASIVRGRRNPINRFLIWVYRPVIDHVLTAKSLTILIALVAVVVTLWPARQLGSEFMPDLDEGVLMYMPTTLPGLSVTKAAELLQVQNRIIKPFPKVASVYGKAGRALTATGPAPMEMFETIINLKPKVEWCPGVTVESLKNEMDRALQFPGVSNAWTMPIKARIDMLSTGIRRPVSVKMFGADLAQIKRTAGEIESVLRTVPGTSSAYAERIIGGWLMWWLGFNMSVAVAVGFIALAGVAAQTVVVMLVYIDRAMADLKAERVVSGFTRADLNQAITFGAVERRVRPKMMMVAVIIAGFLPIMWSAGAGPEVMQRIAVPMIGGMISSTILTLVVIPAV